MNKILYAFVFTLMVNTLLAQSSAVTNAILYHKDNDLDKARQEIDKAVVHEKTKADPKAWYYKGVIYSDISRSQNLAISGLAPDGLRQGVNAFTKSMELDASKGEYYKLSESKLKELWAEVINKGIAEYESEKLGDAKNWFELAQQINPADTSAYIYGSYAAESMQDNDALKRYSEKLISLNYKSSYVYRNLIFVEKDPTLKLKVAQKALSELPEDEALLETLGDIYSNQGNHQEALVAYKKLSSRMPENAIVLTKMAMQHERLSEQEKALELYEKVVSLDNLNFLAHYNAAIIYFEKGKVANDKIHALSMNDYHAKGKQMEDEMNGLFNKSLTHSNIALQLTKDEEDIQNIKLMMNEINKVIKK